MRELVEGRAQSRRWSSTPRLRSRTVPLVTGPPRSACKPGSPGRCATPAWWRATLAAAVVILVLMAPLLTSTSPTTQDVLARPGAVARAPDGRRPVRPGHLHPGPVRGPGHSSRQRRGGPPRRHVGTVLGLMAGFAGGWVNFVVMRLVDLMLAFPGILLALAVTAILGPGFIRCARRRDRADPGLCAGGRERHGRDPPHAIRRWRRTLGAPSPDRLRHILPNVASTIVVLSTSWLGVAVLWLSALGFIGLGVQPPSPEWGALLNDGQTYITLAWWITLFPGVFLALFVIGMNLIGDGLRDELDPTLARDWRSRHRPARSGKQEARKRHRGGSAGVLRWPRVRLYRRRRHRAGRSERLTVGWA